MPPFTTLQAVAVPLAVANIDTDQILPARFLCRGWTAGSPTLRNAGAGWSRPASTQC